MNFRIVIINFLLCLSISSLYSNSEIYDYQVEEELVDKVNEELEERDLRIWSDNKILLHYSTDLLNSSKNKLYFQANNQNIKTLVNKKEDEPLRVFAQYKARNLALGFGNFRPVFGLGTIYKNSASQDYLAKVSSTSQLDLQGFFTTYQLNSYKLNFFYSKSKLNTVIDADGLRRIVYYDSEKIDFRQEGLVLTSVYNELEISLLAALYSTSQEIEQFSNKANSLLLSSYLKYQKESIDVQYENNYQFSQFAHSIKAKFSRDDFVSTWKYQALPAHSLNWLNSGISNKYNTNSRLYFGECAFPLSSFKFKLGSELKSNHEINQWRNRNSLEITKSQKIGYRIIQDIYRDYQDLEQEKFTHSFKLKLFTFVKSNILFHYTLNNKNKSGTANSYRIEFNSDTKYGKLKIDLKVLDNYKNEEIIQDANENIIATFYEFSEDFLLFLNYQTPEFKNIMLKSSLTHSLFNDKLNSFKIELSCSY